MSCRLVLTSYVGELDLIHVLFQTESVLRKRGRMLHM